MKYKVGDKVKIKTWEEMKKEFDLSISGQIILIKRHNFIQAMEEDINENFPDRILTIKIVNESSYFMKDDKYICSWTDDMIKCLAKNNKPELIQSITNRFEILDL